MPGLQIFGGGRGCWVKAARPVVRLFIIFPLAPSHQQPPGGEPPSMHCAGAVPLLCNGVSLPWRGLRRGGGKQRGTHLEAAAVLRFFSRRRCLRRSSGSSIASRSGTGSFRLPRRFAPPGARGCPVVPPSERRPVCTEPRLSLRDPPVGPAVSMLLLRGEKTRPQPSCELYPQCET